MKKYFKTIIKTIILSLIFLTNSVNFARDTTIQKTANKVIAKNKRAHDMTPQKAINKLIAGNKRYVKDSAACIEPLSTIRARVSRKQTPFAIIVSCSDSRVPTEIVFDQRLGDLFVVRTAGQVISSAGLGSIEYALNTLGSCLIVVLGHERCGAVEATLSALKEHTTFNNHIQTVIDGIKPALIHTHSSDIHTDTNKKDKELSTAVEDNVKFIVKKLPNKSSVIKDLLKKDKIKVVGAVYDLDSGKVKFL